MKSFYNHRGGKGGEKPVHYGSYDLVDYVCDNRRSQRLFQRCDTPALPFRERYYSQAKRLEYDGDLAGALGMFYKALANGERVDSCLKDIAGLLNMMGRTAEAVGFLQSHSDQVTGKAGYVNLLKRLQSELLKESASDLPKGITVTVADRSLGPVSVALCDRLFPNPAKIRRILLTDQEGYVGAIHFATHSSARKALQTPKLFSHLQVTCQWSNVYTEARLDMISQMESESHQFELTTYEPLPVHLRTFGGSGHIPIYREHDESIPALPQESLEELEKNARKSPLSPGESTVPGTPNESTSPAAPKSYIAPFISEVVHPDGRIGTALVVPLETDPAQADLYRTPIKPRNVCHFKTPSPIVERSLFT